MTVILKRLWQDDRGFVVSTELIFLATITVIGLLVGLVIWRDGLVQELGDTGAAIGQFNQSYSIEIQSNPECGISVNGDAVTVDRSYGCVDVQTSFRNFRYTDESDVCDGQDIQGQPAAGIDLSVSPQDESGQ